jgi:hypothetical protein
MPTPYQLAAEALVEVADHDAITVPGSGVGGLYPTQTMAIVAASAVRSVVAQKIHGLFPVYDCANAVDRIVDVAPVRGDRWAVRVAQFPLGNAPVVWSAAAYCDHVRAELADLLQILVEGDAGEIAVSARRFGPPETLEQEVARLRRRVAELEAQLAGRT